VNAKPQSDAGFCHTTDIVLIPHNLWGNNE